MSHAAFVYLSYGVTAAVFAAVVAWLLADRAWTIRELARLEAEGVHRRSDKAED